MDIFTCFKAAVAALQITAPPALTINPDLPYLGMYTPSTIHIRGLDTNCDVVFHEMVHHVQFSMRGLPKTEREVLMDEREAVMLTNKFRGGGEY